VPLDLRELQRLAEVASRAGQRRVHVGLELLPGARCFRHGVSVRRKHGKRAYPPIGGHQIHPDCRPIGGRHNGTTLAPLGEARPW
jgi:hypothetical protein